MPDGKITDFSADTAPTSDDLVVVVNDAAGTPANKKVTLANLAKGIGTAWTSYTPTLASIAIGTGGSAINEGHYLQIGKTVWARGRVILGNTGQSVSGDITIGLPVTSVATPSTVFPIGYANLIDSGTNQHMALVYWTSTTTFRLRPLNAAGTYAANGTATSSTVPFTWAADDAIFWQITFEAA